MIAQGKVQETDMQSAIWVVASGAPISYMNTTGDEEYLKLLRFVADATGQSLPWYTVVYNQRDGQIFQNRPMKVTGEYKFDMCQQAFVTMIVYDKNGQAVYLPYVDKVMPQGEVNHQVNWDVSTLPKGEYTLRRWENGYKKDEKVIEI